MTNQNTLRKIIGISPEGEEHLLIEVDNVEEHDNQSSDYNLYVRVTIYDKNLKDTFIFSSDDFKVVSNYLQTNENSSLKLLEKYMQLLQSNTTLSNFITEISTQYFGADLGYKKIRVA